MTTNPCPNCGEPKHPLKLCARCRYSAYHEKVLEPKKKGKDANPGTRPPVPSPNPTGLGKLERKTIPQEFIENWKKFIRGVGDKPETAEFRRGSPTAKAAPWVLGTTSPKMPMKIQPKAQLFSCWICPSTHLFAKEFIIRNPDATFFDLQEAILSQLNSATVQYPYIWWLRVGHSISRVIYKDADDITYVKLHYKWELAYSLQHTGGLVGAQGGANHRYEDVPKSNYFVCTDNDGFVRTGYQCTINPLNERKYLDWG